MIDFSGQLSKQYHYDFGLRALKSVLVMAGELKRGDADLPEDVVLMRALRDMNLPKFVFEDVPLFNGLIADLFPGLDCPRVGYPEINAAVESSLAEKNYVIIENDAKMKIQVDKVIQLYETMLTRHTTMVVGNTGGGKSVVINALKDAQNKLGLMTKMFTVNAKAQTVNELYGILDPQTRDWQDGLLSKIFREICRPTDKKEKRIILFDSDVDALWVENMNSVMDDNKILTLPNGERIRLPSHCALLVEVADLQYASPATVSRCGMVYVDPKNLGYMPFWKTYVAQRPGEEAHKELLATLFDTFVPTLIDRILDGVLEGQMVGRLNMIIPRTNLNMVRQLADVLTAMLKPTPDEADDGKLTAVFLCAMTWSLGASLLEDDRVIFDSLVKKLSELPTNPGDNVGPGTIPVGQPTLFEYYYDVEKERWVSWTSIVPEYVHEPGKPFHEILVPTTDTVRTSWLLNLSVMIGQPILLVGETGTSKTATTTSFLNQLDTDTTLVLQMNFSSRTTSMDVQRNLEANVEKRTKTIFGPPPGKRLLVFMDDLNMPQVDTYGTQQPIALLKLLIEHGGFYDRGKDLNWKTIKDMGYLAAMGKPGGGRNPVDPRFISLFSVCNVTFPAQASLIKIYSSILGGHLAGFDLTVKDHADTFTKATMDLYANIVESLPPTPAKFHYIFNLRDLSRIYEGMLLATPDVVTSLPVLVRLWRNESLRVFHDRLTTAEDKSYVNEQLAKIVKSSWPDCVGVAMEDPILFGDFRNAMEPEKPRLYESWSSYEVCKSVFDKILETYNEDHTAMDLVLFEDALEHVCRVHRIIRMGRGHALLVGVGGSGKQSLTRLAAFTAGCDQVFEITLSRGYGEEEFREDLKVLYQIVGIEKKKTVFLFTDAHVVEEGFLELVNNILTSGMVPALYHDDEKDAIINQVRDDVTKLGQSGSKENCWKYFVNVCSNNLHVVLAMSPSGDTLRTRCRNFPGLVSNTVIDWFMPWPEQALTAVATKFLSTEDTEGTQIPQQHYMSIVAHVVHVHESVRQYSVDFLEKLRRTNFVTPKNYLDFLKNYLVLLDEKDKSVLAQCDRLDGGVKKIEEATIALDVLNAQLEVQKVTLAESTAACAIMLAEISDKTIEATESQKMAEAKGSEMEIQSVEIQKEKKEAEDALAVALPALEEVSPLLLSFFPPPRPNKTNEQNE